MPNPIPLRRELLLSFAVLFVAAVLVAVAGVLLLLPLLPFASPLAAAAFISTLVIGDLAVMFWFGHRMLRDRGVLDNALVAHGYLSVLREASARPA